MQINNPKLLLLSIHEPSIIELNLTSYQTKVLISGLGGTPDGIQTDKRHQRIYWTNMGADFTQPDGTIETASLDGSQRRTLVGGGAITTPKQLELDSDNQLLYWCDREGARIMRCRTDGSGLTTLVARAPESKEPRDILHQCVGIAIDHQNQQIYWTQKGPAKGNKGRIFRANLDIPAGEDAAHRSDIETLLDLLPEPIDLSIDCANHLLYWTDRGAPPAGNSLNCATFSQAGLSNHRVICTGFDETIGLTLDSQNNTAYVADLGGNVYRVDLTDGNYRSLYQHGSITGIALF